MNKLSLIASSLMVAAAIVPAAALAQTVNVTSSANISASPITTSVKVSAKPGVSLNVVIARADAEITRRITNLNSLSARIGQMKNVSASEKTSLQGSITTQIATLTSLKATIDTSTSLASLQADIQSITKDYRVYMLTIPQGRIAASADRIQTIVADMQALAPKLQARITAAQTAGKDVTGAEAAYTDMQTKVSDANTQASVAISETSSLSPDQGNATVEASNTAAVKDAAVKIKAATADLKAARADVTTILNAVKGTGSVTASSSVQ